MTHPDTQQSSQPFPTLPALALALAWLTNSPVLLAFAELTPQAEQSFNRYIQLTEQRRKLAPDPAPGRDLHIEARKTLDSGKEIKFPGAMVQDWQGGLFLPNTTISRVEAVMRDYAAYPKIFAPEISESQIISHDSDRYRVFLKLYKKQILTVVLNSTYDVTYTALDSERFLVDSRSARIAEVKDGKELPPGQDNGFLWYLNSYWRFRRADGGVYAECEAVSLSRDVPLGLWFIRKFVERFPRESMQKTLEGLQRAVAADSH